MLKVICYEDTGGSPYMTWKHPIPGRWHCVLEDRIIYKGRYPHIGSAWALINEGQPPDENIVTMTRFGTIVFNTTLADLSKLKKRKWKLAPATHSDTPGIDDDQE